MIGFSHRCMCSDRRIGAPEKQFFGIRTSIAFLFLQLSMVNHYELLLIYPGTQTDEEAQQRTEAVQGILAQNGATVTLHEFWGKRKLAYEIDHIRHGYYDLFEFDIEATHLQKMETSIRLNDLILRHQIVSKEVKSPERLAADAALRERIAAKREAIREKEQGTQIAGQPVEAPAEAPSAPVAPEQLDQKLEEILDSEKVDV